jgi:predicted transposase/invertase (TIGR01784 family)
MREKYINPFTDFGFKKLFGEEANKDLIIDFLNELLGEKGKITSLTFLKTENLGVTETDRKAIYDLYCQNEAGEKFIVELQKAKQRYFKDRSLYYSSFAIQEQAKKGDWDYQLQRVYTIAVMDFVFDDLAIHSEKMRHDVQLMDIETGILFYDKLRFIYLEMPKFTKTIDELETHYDKWLYVLQNLSRLDAIPDKFRERIFIKLFEIAEIAKYNEQEQRAYQDSLKYYRDWKNVLDTAIEDALDKYKIDLIKKMILMSLSDAIISEATGASISQIQNFRIELN